VEGVELVGELVDHAEGQPDQFPRGWVEPGAPPEPGALVGGEQVPLGWAAVVEQGRVEALLAGAPLVQQRLVAAHAGAGFQHVHRWDPRLGQRARRQQLTQMPGGVARSGVTPRPRTAW
jgi:hypothetical protein